MRCRVCAGVRFRLRARLCTKLHTCLRSLVRGRPLIDCFRLFRQHLVQYDINNKNRDKGYQQYAHKVQKDQPECLAPGFILVSRKVHGLRNLLWVRLEWPPNLQRSAAWHLEYARKRTPACWSGRCCAGYYRR